MDGDTGKPSGGETEESLTNPTSDNVDNTDNTTLITQHDTNNTTQHNTERKSTRTKKGSDESKEFRLKTTTSFMKTTRNRLTKQIKIVDALLRGTNVEPVNNEMVSVERTYVEISDAYARSCEMFQEDDNENIEQSEIGRLMEETDNIYLECKERVCEFLLQRDMEDRKSTSSHGSKRSKGSKSSSSSSSPKIKAARKATIAITPIARSAFSPLDISVSGFSLVKDALRCSVVRLAVINPTSEFKTSIV